MWKLTMRGARGTPFEDLGSHANLTDVAEAIQKIENNHEGIFFRVWVDPINPLSPADDAAALSSLDYQTAKHYYSLTRSAQ
jgi:hypothetical protein